MTRCSARRLSEKHGTTYHFPHVCLIEHPDNPRRQGGLTARVFFATCGLCNYESDLYMIRRVPERLLDRHVRTRRHRQRMRELDGTND